MVRFSVAAAAPSRIPVPVSAAGRSLPRRHIFTLAERAGIRTISQNDLSIFGAGYSAAPSNGDCYLRPSSKTQDTLVAGIGGTKRNDKERQSTSSGHADPTHAKETVYHFDPYACELRPVLCAGRNTGNIQAPALDLPASTGQHLRRLAEESHILAQLRREERESEIARSRAEYGLEWFERQLRLSREWQTRMAGGIEEEQFATMLWLGTEISRVYADLEGEMPQRDRDLEILRPLEESLAWLDS